MNLFRSEEHATAWAGFKSGTEEGLVPLDDLVKLFSGPYFTRRLDPDWVQNSHRYARRMVADMIELGLTGPHWRPPGR